MSRYYSLKDIAERLDVPVHVLRYWIRILGITGKKKSNRMYFSERDVNYFIGVSILIEKGYSLNSIKSMIKDSGRSILLKWAERGLIERILKDIRVCIREVGILIAKLDEIENVF